METDLLNAQHDTKRLRHDVRVGLTQCWQEEDSIFAGSSSLYSLSIGIIGTSQCSELHSVEIEIDLSDAACTISDHWPKKLQTQRATVAVTSPAAGLAPTVGLQVPVHRQNIDADQQAKKARWILRDERLEDLAAYPRVALKIDFDKNLPEGEVAMTVRVTPDLRTNGVLGRRSRALDDYYERNLQLTIRPQPTELTEEYQLDVAEGILRKTGIRNVALRAKTLGLLFDHFNANLGRGYRATIRRIGYAIGENFTLDYVQRTKNALNLTEWSDYDAAAGFGRLKFDLRKMALVG